jgi:hypothetical protein
MVTFCERNARSFLGSDKALFAILGSVTTILRDAPTPTFDTMRRKLVSRRN